MYDNSFEGVVFADDTEVAGASGTSEQILKSFSVPANSLNKNGQALRIKALFKHAANTDNVNFRLYFGGSSIATGNKATSGELLELEMLVSRRAAGSQLVWASGQESNGPAIFAPALTAGSDDETTALLIKATVTGGTSGVDGLCESLRVEFLQAP